MQKVLVLDAYNLMHRARSGFTKGSWPVVFNFFRGLRPLVEQFKPDVTYFVLEGNPTARTSALPTYKGSRVVTQEANPKAYEELVQFHRQKDRIIRIVRDFMPFRTVRHPYLEGDDLIANIVLKWHPDDQSVIVSGDSDFIQLLQASKNVKLYHPIKKEFLSAPTYDYIAWKALKGDSTDEIPGISGIGEKTAEKILVERGLDEWLGEQTEDVRQQFRMNEDLIMLQILDSEGRSEVEMSQPSGDWDEVKREFAQMGFNSIVREPTWTKFVATFAGS